MLIGIKDLEEFSVGVAWTSSCIPVWDTPEELLKSLHDEQQETPRRLIWGHSCKACL